MQPPTDGPRASLSLEQVVGIIQDAPAVKMGFGAELVDQALNVVEDISSDVAGGSVSRSAYATLHGTCRLDLSRILDWPTALVRPYVTLSDGVVTAQFRLGAYYTNVPRTPRGISPATWDVQGFDILHAFNSPVGEAYAVDTGVGYLAAVEDILTAQGFTQYVIDQQAADKLLPSAKVWPLDERTTWLAVINDLLAAIGYQGMWSDWDGRLRIGPYQNPRDRPPEWVYDDGDTTSMLAPEGDIEQDWFMTPNRWVAVRSNAIDDVTPVEGAGVYTYTNEYVGPTSVAARNGRVVTRILTLDAADQASLVAQAQASIDADVRLPTRYYPSTFPNPLHWHFDRMLVSESTIGQNVDVVGTQWTLNFDGSMSHEWSLL
jgi:hypothetical protein